MPSKHQRVTPFQRAHFLQYALKIDSHDENNVVVSVSCLFCLHMGREVSLEAASSRKRNITETFKVFSLPFRPENYRKHHDGHHNIAWTKYQELGPEGMKHFFDNMTSRNNTLHRYMDLQSTTLTFNISSSVVDDIIGVMFFYELPEDDEDEQDQDVVLVAQAHATLKRNAMKLFVLQEDLSYVVTINNAIRFELAIDFVSLGMSFRQTAAAIMKSKQRTPNPKLAGITDYMVGGFVRTLVGFNLDILGRVLADTDVFGFSFAGDASSLRENSFFDMRIRVTFRGILYNLHLIIVPQLDRHTANNIVALIVRVLDAVCPSWRTKLLNAGGDGENTMSGWRTGVLTQLDEMALHGILRTWCLPHQIDLVMKSGALIILDGDWIKCTWAFSVHLRSQLILIIEMLSKCPKKTNRWLHLGNLLNWLIAHRPRLMIHVESHQPVSAPSSIWWAITFGIAPAIKEVNIKFRIIQAHLIVISQQREEIRLLVESLNSMFEVKDAAVDRSYVPLPPAEFVMRDGLWVLLSSIREHMEDQGSVARDVMESLDAGEQTTVLCEIAAYAIHLISGISRVKAERDNRNKAAPVDAPPVLPYELVKLRTGMFIREVLDPYRVRMQDVWSPADIMLIEEDHKELVSRYNREDAFKVRLDKHTHKTGFNQAWSDIDDGGQKFSRLRSFVGNLATAFPNTAPVESDYNILKWEKDEFRSSMSHLTIEGIFQAKQFELIKKLASTL